MVFGELANCIVGFPARVHSNEARFHIPVEIRRRYRFKDGQTMGVIIFDAVTSECLFTGIEILRSGGEIYGAALRQALLPGQAITVVLYRPPA